MGEQPHDDLIHDYCLELLAAGRSPRTIGTRRRQVRMICRAVDPHTATRQDLVRWLAHPAWQPSTRNSNRAAARSFFGWLVHPPHWRQLMPRYEITSPDGKRWEVEAPEGAGGHGP